MSDHDLFQELLQETVAVLLDPDPKTFFSTRLMTLYDENDRRLRVDRRSTCSCEECIGPFDPARDEYC